MNYLTQWYLRPGHTETDSRPILADSRRLALLAVGLESARIGEHRCADFGRVVTQDFKSVMLMNQISQSADCKPTWKRLQTDCRPTLTDWRRSHTDCTPTRQTSDRLNNDFRPTRPTQNRPVSDSKPIHTDSARFRHFPYAQIQILQTGERYNNVCWFLPCISSWATNGWSVGVCAFLFTSLSLKLLFCFSYCRCLLNVDIF